MRITLNGYDVEIKAKYTAGGLVNSNKRMNKADTLSLLSQIAIWAFESAERYDALGVNALGNAASNAANELYKQMDAVGYFNN